MTVSAGYVVKVDGKIVDRPSYQLKPGQVLSVNVEKSAKIAEAIKAIDFVVPAYFESNKDDMKVTILREPMIDEIPAKVETMRVVEYYAR